MATAGGSANPTNSRYYLIVVRYVKSISAKKLASELRALQPPGPGRFNPRYFANLSLAQEGASEELTGYTHNGISSFSMLNKTIPVIMWESILRFRPIFIWMGGGHRDWKLGMVVRKFVKGVNAIVLDISKPRA
jgi:prolyl-tRNA editing enzyme YbaK/EbsC (Cys-tRNA(Pro) deacylase)